MKVYTRVVIDTRTGAIKASKSFEYTGPIAECKGGGGATTSTTKVQGEVDYAYNARMAAIAERQQNMAEEYATFWREEYKPLESEQIAANRAMIPAQMGLEEEKIAAQRELIPAETELRKGMLGMGAAEVEAAKPVMGEYYKEALRGGDIEGEVRAARADVAGSFKEQAGAQRREMGRLGIMPGSERASAMMADRRTEQAKATAGAMTGARRFAEEKRFGRLGGAMQTFKGGLGGQR